MTTRATDKHLTCLFIHTSDNMIYHALKLDLTNKHVIRNDKYPNILEGAQTILNEYKPVGSSGRFPTNEEQSGGAFLLTKAQKKASKVIMAAKTSKATDNDYGVKKNIRGDPQFHMQKK